MTRTALLIFATMMTLLGVSSAYAINDRNNEYICSEPGNVDPRCF